MAKAKPINKPTKEIKLEFVKMVQERNAMYKREERAREYCKEVNRRREQKFEKIREIVTTSAFVITAILVMILIISIPSKTTQTKGDTYVMTGELQGNHVVLEDGNIHEVDKSDANYTNEAMQVTVTLNDNGTENIDDDIIIDIR